VVLRCLLHAQHCHEPGFQEQAGTLPHDASIVPSRSGIRGRRGFLTGTDGNAAQTKATPGVWIGAKVGLFSVNPNIEASDGYTDFDWFRLESGRIGSRV
jgi:hypothetical protein